MRMLVTGSTGFIGAALVRFLKANGQRVIRLVRATPQVPELEIQWDPVAGTIDRTRLNGLDAVIHLAGENIASGRWTPEKKATIRKSRLQVGKHDDQSPDSEKTSVGEQLPRTTPPEKHLRNKE